MGILLLGHQHCIHGPISSLKNEIHHEANQQTIVCTANYCADNDSGEGEGSGGRRADPQAQGPAAGPFFRNYLDCLQE